MTYNAATALLVRGKIKVCRESTEVPSSVLSKSSSALEGQAKVEDALGGECLECVVLSDIEQCGISAATSTFVMSGEIAISDQGFQPLVMPVRGVASVPSRLVVARRLD